MSELKNEPDLIGFITGSQEKFYKIAYSYVKNREDALDIIHNAIVKALQKQTDVKNTAYLQTWFYRILINESISLLRKNKRILFLDEWNSLPDQAAAPEPDGYLDLYQAMDQLPGKLKTIIILRFFEDMSLAEIAAITDTNLSTVKTRLYKALKILKLDLEGVEHD